MGLEAEAMQQAHETDYSTGAYLPREEGVHYRTFPASESESSPENPYFM